MCSSWKQWDGYSKTRTEKVNSIKPSTDFNWRPFSDVKLCIVLKGRQTVIEVVYTDERVLEIIASVDVVTLGGFQHDWKWVSDGVLERSQAEPFVPAAATFQSATDIYTRGLIERLACEPSACTHTLHDSPPFTAAHTPTNTDALQHFTTADTVGFDPVKTEARHVASVTRKASRKLEHKVGSHLFNLTMVNIQLTNVMFRKELRLVRQGESKTNSHYAN